MLQAWRPEPSAARLLTIAATRRVDEDPAVVVAERQRQPSAADESGSAADAVGSQLQGVVGLC